MEGGRAGPDGPPFGVDGGAPGRNPRTDSDGRLSRPSIDSKEAVRRIGLERCQSRIEAEPRRAIGTGYGVRLAHIDVDMRMVVRWGHADALELLHPDADFRDAAVVPEHRIAAAGHRLV